MLDITVVLDILDRLTLLVTTILCHHMKKSIIKKRKRKKIQKYGGTKPKLIY